DTRADTSRRHPHVFQLSLTISDTERVEPTYLTLIVGDVDMMFANEIRGDGEVRFPMPNPVFRITPVTLRIERNLRQRCGLFRYRAPYGHGICHSDPSAYFTRTIKTCSEIPLRSFLSSECTLIRLVGGVVSVKVSSFCFPGPMVCTLVN